MTKTLRLAAQPTVELTDEVTITDPHEVPVVHGADNGGNGIWIGIGLAAGGLFALVVAALAAVVLGVFAVMLGGMMVFASLSTPEPVFLPQQDVYMLPADGALTTDARPPAAPPLRLAVHSTGRKTFELVNLSNRDYTNVTVVMNGEYQYRLRKLVANAGDNMRYGNFVSRRTGEHPSRKVPLKTLTVTADQGSWTGRP